MLKESCRFVLCLRIFVLVIHGYVMLSAMAVKLLWVIERITGIKFMDTYYDENDFLVFRFNRYLFLRAIKLIPGQIRRELKMNEHFMVIFKKVYLSKGNYVDIEFG